MITIKIYDARCYTVQLCLIAAESIRLTSGAFTVLDVIPTERMRSSHSMSRLIVKLATMGLSYTRTNRPPQPAVTCTLRA
jgi:hypothetical protein